MPTFRCHHVLPTVSPRKSIEATDWADAAQTFHLHTDTRDPSLSYGWHVDSDGRNCSISFALVAVAGPDGNIRITPSRLFHYGMGRKGGVAHPSSLRPAQQEYLREIAAKLKWEGDPATLIDDASWTAEESYEEASNRDRLHSFLPAGAKPMASGIYPHAIRGFKWSYHDSWHWLELRHVDEAIEPVRVCGTPRCNGYCGLPKLVIRYSDPELEKERVIAADGRLGVAPVFREGLPKDWPNAVLEVPQEDNERLLKTMWWW